MITYNADTHILNVDTGFRILKSQILVQRDNRKPRLMSYLLFLGYVIDHIIIDAAVIEDFMKSQTWSCLKNNCSRGYTTEVVSDKLYFPKLKKLKFK